MHSWVYICMRTCVYIGTYNNIIITVVYIRKHICINMCSCMCIRKCLCACICACASIPPCHAYMDMSMRVCMCKRTCTFVCIYTCMFKRTHVRIITCG